MIVFRHGIQWCPDHAANVELLMARLTAELAGDAEFEAGFVRDDAAAEARAAGVYKLDAVHEKYTYVAAMIVTDLVAEGPGVYENTLPDAAEAYDELVKLRTLMARKLPDGI